MGAVAELRTKVEDWAKKFLQREEFERWKIIEFDPLKSKVSRQTGSADVQVAQVVADLKARGETLLAEGINRLIAEELKPRIAEILREAVSNQDILDWFNENVDFEAFTESSAIEFAKTLKLEDLKVDLVPAIADLFYQDLDNESLEQSIAEALIDSLQVTMKSE